MPFTLVHSVLLALGAALPLSTPAVASIPAMNCAKTVTAENKLGNFEIQSLAVRVEARTVDGQSHPAEIYSVRLRIAPNAQGRTTITLRTACSVRRSLRITAQAKAPNSSEVVEFVGITAMDDWDAPTHVRFERAR